ncbi:MAG: VOC family protein [Acidobacteria bacterium]|nr:VOC family protein [Acidobacteriota bacterium]
MSSNNVTYLKPHISLNVKDIEKSVEFYSRLFGQGPVKLVKSSSTVHSVVREQAGEESEAPRFGYAKFDVAEPPLNFVLNEVSYSEGGTLSHLGLQVATTEDVLKIREKWTEAGLMTVDEMKVDCCYALQDKTWARDPDGNEWEAFVVLENTEPKAEACGCGEKVEHDELSTNVCCTPGQKATTIGATSAPCC